jgi:hypothetical protein
MSRRNARANDWDLLEVSYPVARNHHMAPGRASSVWWRRRELNPGPKTFSTTALHV